MCSRWLCKSHAFANVHVIPCVDHFTSLPINQTSQHKHLMSKASLEETEIESPIIRAPPPNLPTPLEQKKNTTKVVEMCSQRGFSKGIEAVQRHSMQWSAGLSRKQAQSTANLT